MARLRIIVFREGNWLCAQCIDFDLSAQARTLPSLYRAVHKLILGHIAVRQRHGLRPFKDLPPTPSRFRKMFDQSKVALPSEIIVGRTSAKLPPAEVRVAVAAA